MNAANKQANRSSLRMVSISLLFVWLTSVIFTALSSFAAGQTKVIVHYRPDPSSNYAWNVWMWGDGMDGKAYAFTGEDDFGKVAEYTLDKELSQVGVIIRTDEWVKDTDGDRFIPINNGVGEVWLIGGDTKLYTEKPEIEAPPAKSGKPGEAVVSIHYFRPDGNYANWYLAAKTSSQPVQYIPFVPGGANGATAETTFTNVATDANVSYDIIQVTDPKLIDKKPLTELKFQQEGTTVYASEWTKTYGVVERFHIQADPKVYTKAADVPKNARFLKAYLTELNQIHILGNGGSTGGLDPTAITVLVNGSEVELQSVTASSLDNTANWTVQLKNDLDITAPIVVNSPTFGSVAVQPGQIWYANRFLASFFSPNQELGLTAKDGTIMLRVWAPLANSVSVELLESDGQNVGTQTMLAPAGQGVWQTTLDSSTYGKYYRFVAKIHGKTVVWTDPYAKQLTLTGDRALIVDPAKRPKIDARSDQAQSGATILKTNRHSLFALDLNAFQNPLDSTVAYEEAQKLINEAHATGSKVYIDLSLDTLRQAGKFGWEQTNPGLVLDQQRLINYNQAHVQAWLNQAIVHWIGTWQLDGVIIREWTQLDPGFQKQLLSAVQSVNSNAVILDYLPLKEETKAAEPTQATVTTTTSASVDPLPILIFVVILIGSIVYVTLREFGKEAPDQHK